MISYGSKTCASVTYPQLDFRQELSLMCFVYLGSLPGLHSKEQGQVRDGGGARIRLNH